MSIDIGVHNRVGKEPWAKSVKVEKVILHENFKLQENFISYINDVALVKLTVKRIIKNICRFKFSYFLFLKKPIVLDDKYYVPACLPDNDLDFDSQNKTAWLTGWGISLFL